MIRSFDMGTFNLSFLDRLFLWLRSKPLFYRFALFTRVLLVAGFIPTGLVKLMGERFTTISVETPIGAFFEAMYQTGLYWQFIGLCQIVAALLLLVPAFAHLGAALFCGIILNIFVITVSLGFTGTPLVTGSMLLATIYLCAWDFHRFRPLFSLRPLGADVPEHRLDRWEFAGFAVFALGLLGAFLFTRGYMPSLVARFSIAAGLAAGLFTLGRFLWLCRRGRLG